MKVLQLCKFYPPVSGGMEAVVYELTQGLTRHGVEVEVLCANTGARTVSERAEGGYDIVRAGAWARLLSMSVSPPLLMHTKRMSTQADVVHVHMPDPMTALALWLAKPRGKLVVHWHSDVIRQRLALQVYRPLQDWLLRRADAIVATSEAYAESSPWLRPWRHKTAVIPIGISDPRSEVDPAAVARIRERFGGRRIVFSLGRMTYYKGFDVLIDAAADVQDGCVIIVGGEGELLGRYRDQVARRGLTHKIAFVGHIPQQELAAYFSAATLFCLASTQRAEAYGVVLLEAMAMGRPVVATEIPGSAVPWVNQSGVTGLNVPVDDAGALADAVNRIVGDQSYAERFGKAGRDRFERYLSADGMVQATMHLYSRLLSKSQLP
jgi:glycosyltransferase involved in cell wall biosynthesis